MNNRLLSLLGLARRCGKLAAGFDAAVESAADGEARLILVAWDAAARTQRNIRQEAERYGVTVLPVRESKDEIGKAIGAASTGIVSIRDAGFAAKIRQLAADTAGQKFQHGED